MQRRSSLRKIHRRSAEAPHGAKVVLGSYRRKRTHGIATRDGAFVPSCSTHCHSTFRVLFSRNRLWRSRATLCVSTPRSAPKGVRLRRDDSSRGRLRRRLCDVQAACVHSEHRLALDLRRDILVCDQQSRLAALPRGRAGQRESHCRVVVAGRGAARRRLAAPHGARSSERLGTQRGAIKATDRTTVARAFESFTGEGGREQRGKAERSRRRGRGGQGARGNRQAEPGRRGNSAAREAAEASEGRGRTRKQACGKTKKRQSRARERKRKARHDDGRVQFSAARAQGVGKAD